MSSSHLAFSHSNFKPTYAARDYLLCDTANNTVESVIVLYKQSIIPHLVNEETAPLSFKRPHDKAAHHSLIPCGRSFHPTSDLLKPRNAIFNDPTTARKQPLAVCRLEHVSEASECDGSRDGGWRRSRPRESSYIAEDMGPGAD